MPKRVPKLRLIDYERLLGEDFESLTQARKAYARETSAATKAAQKRVEKLARQSKAAQKDVKKTGAKLKKLKSETKKQGKQILKTAKAIGKALKNVKQAAKGAAAKAKKRKSAATVPPKSTGRKSAKRPNVSPAPSKTRTKTRQPTQVTPKLPTRRRVYEMRDLPESANNVIFNGTVEDLLEVSPEYDALLRPGDIWAFRFGTPERGGYSYTAFGSFAQMLDTISHYKTIRTFGDDPAAYDDLLDMVKIIRFKGRGKNLSQFDSAKAWGARKRAEVTKRREKVEARRVKERAARREAAREKRELQAQLKAEKQHREQQESILKEMRKRTQREHEELMLEKARSKSLKRKLERAETKVVQQIHEEVKHLKRVPKKGKKKGGTK